MYNKDSENIAKLYMEYTVNPNYEDDMERQKLTKVLTGMLVDMKFPFVFLGQTPNSEGEVEELTVAGMPIKDYQVKNMVHALMTGSLEIDSEPKYEKYSEMVISKMLAHLHKRMNQPDGPLTQAYNTQQFDPNALAPKKKPRWNPGDDLTGGVQ